MNPVAHIIELCTLVYPQKYGKPDPDARGMTGPKAQAGSLRHQSAWGGLAEEVRYWGNWVLEKVRAEIGDLYPLIPDPEYKDSKFGSTGGPPVQNELFITRRNLPHWQLGGSTYFLTYRCRPGLVLKESERSIVLENWKHWDGKRYLLHAAVVMQDHVHVLITPTLKGQGTWFSLEEIFHTNKSFTAHEINKTTGQTGSLWQDERFDRIVRDEQEFLEKWNYIRNNPVKAGLAQTPEEYPWLYETSDAWGACTGQRPVPPNRVPPGYLVPVAYLWTRTVRCKNPTCGATVPLVRQTWLCKKKDRYVALKMVTGSPGGSPVGTGSPGGSPVEKKVRFEVVESATEKGLGFDPAGFSKGGNATCPFCGTVADSGYVKKEGQAGRLSHQMMAIVCTRPGRQGKVYLSADDYPEFAPDDEAIRQRIEALCQRTGLTVPSEPIINDAKSANYCVLYGLTTFGDLFTPRQMLCLLTFAAAVREAYNMMVGQAAGLSGTGKMSVPPYDAERGKAVGTYLGLAIDRIADRGSSLCHWDNAYTKTANTFGRQALPMVWDFTEVNPFGDSSGDAMQAIEWVALVAQAQGDCALPATVTRGSATALPWSSGTGGSPVLFDAVITDPPYYDNVPYADISDFFYVWLKRTVGHLYPEHFATEGTPKKQEAVADAVRYGGSKEKARTAYEHMMAQSFAEANRVLKPGGSMVVVYAHKTTLGWSTLVDALRQAGFTVTEAWPLDTEMKSRLRGRDSAALASSIFLVARKRVGSTGGSPVAQSTGQRPVPPDVGSYEDEVRPELEQIVRERVDSLWKMGITGADLVIAAVGAGLRAYTRFSRVEYANGEEVPSEKFLAEVEGVVLETLLEKIFGMPGSGVAAVDGPSRFYVLWRYAYKAAEMEAGEAIVFTYGQGVELDGPNGLAGRRPAPLLEKKKGKYRLRDFTERGEAEKLGLLVGQAAGLASAGWQPAPLIDILHRILWLVENQPRALNKFLDEARPDRERLRLVAQALAGTALERGSVREWESDRAGGHTTAAEQAALKKLLANWKALIERTAMPLFDRASRSE